MIPSEDVTDMTLVEDINDHDDHVNVILPYNLSCHENLSSYEKKVKGVISVFPLQPLIIALNKSEW